MFRKILSPFILLISLFFANVVFGQSVGDYRSNVATGNWTTLSSWQYYDGLSWVTPSGTSPQGYPGQYAGAGTVLIQTGHAITINSAITTLSFGTLTITGTLTLAGDNSAGGMDFYLTTQSIIVTPAAGFIEFNSKVNLRLPINATVQVTIGGLDVSSGCSANQVIYIGTTAYSKCNGGGSLPDFDDLMAGGGTLSPIATSNSPVCQNNTVNLLGSFSGVSGTTTSGGSISGVNYSWSVQAPDASTQTSSLQNYSFTASQTGNYLATLTCTTYFGTTLYTNSTTITVTVTLDLLSVAINLNGSPNVCLLGTGTFLNVVETVGATIASRQWGIRSVSGGTITPIGGQTASAFTAGTGLVVGTWIIVCTSTSACGVSVVSNELTITINGVPPAPGPITGSQNQCVGNTSQVYSVDPVSGATSYNWNVPADWTITSGAGTNAITVTVGANSGNINVDAINECGAGYGPYIYVTVSQPTVPGALTPANTNTCSSGAYASLTLSGHTGDVVGWESSTDNFVSQISYISNTYNPFNPFSVNTYTQDTYFRAVVLNGGCDFAYSNSVLVTISPAMTNPGGISVNGTAYPPNEGVTHCANTSTVLSIDPIVNAADYTWITPSGWTITSGLGTSSITVTTGDTSTSGNVQVYASNIGCGNTGSSYLYFNLVPSSAPTVALIQPTCAVATGTITVTSPAPSSGITYTLIGTNPVVAGVTNATGVFSNLAPGNYDVTVNNASYDDIVAAFPKAVTPLSNCVATASVTINPLVTKTWNGAWSPLPGVAPTKDDFVIIDANYSTSSNGDLNACSLVINSGYTLTVEAEHFVIIQNNLTINGLLAVLDKGSLVMVDDAGTVTGSANIHRFTTPFKRYDYTYWSTPVVSTSIAARFTGWRINYAFEYRPENFVDSNGDNIDDNQNDWVFASTMTPAKGYAIMVPDPTTGPLGNLREVVFTGVVNNGVKKITGVIPSGSYLLGNPYPSALDADTFLDYNAGVLDGTLYFWTHNTAIQLASNITNGTAGSGVYAFTTDDYASYNAVGGVGVGSGTAAITGGTIPTGKIGSCQGFFATSNATIIGVNEIVFNNSMRLGPGGTTLDNSQFFKTKNSKSKMVNTVEKHRIWLNLSNAKGAFKQTLIGYVTGATNDNDSRFDGGTMDGNQFVDFYSINKEKNLVIQGRALPFDENDAVPLGYRTTIAGIFTINIQQVDGVLTNQDVFIEDKLTNTVFDLKAGNYTFNTAVGTFNNRFVLRYRNDIVNKTLGTNDLQTAVNEVLVSSMNKQIKINSFAEIIDNVTVYDVLGRQILQKIKVDANELLITDLVSSNQTFVVKTELQNGTIVTDKIIF